ncbi:transposase [Microcoleus sp. herbarium2]|uniref:transposase n=1 Tax=Microcoleus sp. herbarium2 TaxID=3055433 RepID=UPI002FD77722
MRKKLGLNRKKTRYSSQAGTERVQKLRVEYWEKIRNVEARNLVFLDETAMMLGLARSPARSPLRTRVGGIKPFYRGATVTAIGAISLKKVLALMILNSSMDGAALSVFIEKFLCPQLWSGAVVVMDNLPAHKLTSILPMIKSLSASVICLYPYSPDFNPIEMWCHSLNRFCEGLLPRHQQ